MVVAGGPTKRGMTNFDFHAIVRIGGHESVMRELR